MHKVFVCILQIGRSEKTCLFLEISANICVFVRVCVCSECAFTANVFYSQRRSKPSSSVAAAVREPVPEWEQSNEWNRRVQPPGEKKKKKKEKYSLRIAAASRPSGVLSSSMPPSTTTSNYRLIITRRHFLVGISTQHNLSVLDSKLLTAVTKRMKAERWDELMIRDVWLVALGLDNS